MPKITIDPPLSDAERREMQAYFNACESERKYGSVPEDDLLPYGSHRSMYNYLLHFYGLKIAATSAAVYAAAKMILGL